MDIKLLINVDLQFLLVRKRKKQHRKSGRIHEKRTSIKKSGRHCRRITVIVIFLFTFLCTIHVRRYEGFLLQALNRNMLIETLNAETVMDMYVESIKEMAIIVLPIMVIAIIAGIGANFFQFGLLFTTETLKIDLKKWIRSKGSKR